MLSIRTDLAQESCEMAARGGTLPGVRTQTTRCEGFSCTEVEVFSEDGAKAIGKPMGHYRTIDLSGLLRHEPDAFPRAVRAIAAALRTLLPESGLILAAGLGNRHITPDALGPLCMEHLLVTRHLTGLPDFADFRPVAAMTPGVLAQTGMESLTQVQAAVQMLHPAAAVIIDALAARRMERLCTTVQIADAGIVPGSGVDNARAGFSRETLGIPVIAVGVPTVVDAAVLAADALEEAGVKADYEEIRQRKRGLIVTPREIDARIAEMAKATGFGITLALQKDMTVEELETLLA